MASLTDVAKVLDYRTLASVYSEAGRDNLALNTYFNMYTGGAREQFRNDEVEFVKLSRTKDPMPLNHRGSPARVVTPTGKDRAYLRMLNMYDVLELGMDTLQMLRNPDQWVLQDKGREEVAQQTTDLATRHSVAKQVFMAKYMSSQTIWIDGNGDILESSTGAVETIATGIPTQNIGQVPGAGFGITGDIIDAAWDVAGTKILTQLDKLNEAAEAQNSEPLRHIWIHRSNKFWLRQNTEILAMYSAGQDRLDNALSGDTFELNGYTFHFYGGTYTTTAAATGYYVPKAQAIITPDPGDGRWIMNADGLQLVPTQSGVMPTVEAALSNWTDVFGDFAYASVVDNPPRTQLFAGSNWLFGFKSPKSTFAPTVDF